MVKNIQAIRRQIADELFECVWPFCGISTWTIDPPAPSGKKKENKNKRPS